MYSTLFFYGGFFEEMVDIFSAGSGSHGSSCTRACLY